MNASVKAGVGLALGVAVVSLLVAATGLHTNFLIGGLGVIVVFILLNIGMVV